MTNTHVITRLGVAALLRSGWQPSRETGGSLHVKRVAGFSEIRTLETKPLVFLSRNSVMEGKGLNLRLPFLTIQPILSCNQTVFIIL